MVTRVQPCALEAVEGALDGGADLGVEAFAEVLGGYADAEAGDGLCERGHVVGDGAVGAGGVERVAAGEHLKASWRRR